MTGRLTGLVTEVSQLNARARAGEERICFPFYFLFGHIINNLLTELGRSVWENLDLDRWYRPHCVRSVLAIDLGQDSPIQTSRSVNKN